MEKFTTLNVSRSAAILRENIDTDIVIPISRMVGNFDARHVSGNGASAPFATSRTARKTRSSFSTARPYRGRTNPH